MCWCIWFRVNGIPAQRDRILYIYISWLVNPLGQRGNCWTNGIKIGLRHRQYVLTLSITITQTTSPVTNARIVYEHGVVAVSIDALHAIPEHSLSLYQHLCTTCDSPAISRGKKSSAAHNYYACYYYIESYCDTVSDWNRNKSHNKPL